MAVSILLAKYHGLRASPCLRIGVSSSLETMAYVEYGSQECFVGTDLKGWKDLLVHELCALCKIKLDVKRLLSQHLFLCVSSACLRVAPRKMSKSCLLPLHLSMILLYVSVVLRFRSQLSCGDESRLPSFGFQISPKR